MFTGIIRDVGEIVDRKKKDQALTLSIRTALFPTHLEDGYSVACNGCCLTVTGNTTTADGKSIFTVDIGPQSYDLTQFLHLPTGSWINLEPALRIGDSLGGHHVTGHVDTLGTVRTFAPTKEGFWELSVAVPLSFRRWVLPKGSIALSGVSLTIAQVAFTASEILMTVMLIPHTLQKTNLLKLQTGQTIEVEFDTQVKAISNAIEQLLPHFLTEQGFRI